MTKADFLALARDLAETTRGYVAGALKDITARLDAVESTIAAGRTDEAETALLEALQKNPRDAPRLMMLGGLFVRANRFSEAATIYERAIEVEPTGEAYVELARVLVALNRAVAVAEVDGPGAALTLVDELQLSEYRMFHAIRADLLRRLDRRDEAIAAYEAAIALTRTDAERAFLRRRAEDLK